MTANRLIFNRLARYWIPYRKKLTLALLAMAAVSGLTSLTMYLLKPVLDQGFIGRDIHFLHRIFWLIPILFLVKGALAYLQNYLMAFTSYRIATRIRQEMFDHLQTLSIDYFVENTTGRLMSRFTNDLSVLQTCLRNIPVYLFRDGLTSIGLIALLFYLNARFALLALIILPVTALLVYLVGSALRRYTRKGFRQMAELYSRIQENVEGATVVRAYGAEDSEKTLFAAENEHFFVLTMKFISTDLLASPILEWIGSLVITFILWSGGNMVVNGTWSTGGFVAFVAAALSTYKPIKNFTELNSYLQQAFSSAERVFELLDTKPTVVDPAAPVFLPPFKEKIEYRNVTMRYPGQAQPALQDLSFSIKHGEMVAVVGPSGAGKTTLALLLPRLFDPVSGSLWIDDSPIRDVSLRDLRSRVGLVTQETVLFDESLRYNIAFGNQSATQEQIETAARAANAHPFIARLPDGYDTPIGEKGVKLSGGERQRISIARALLKNPPILILDEATSSLDAESERLVQEALANLMANRTVLVIAHRLATVRKADRILVLERGRLIEQGTHSELLKHHGLYHKLHQLQFMEDSK